MFYRFAAEAIIWFAVVALAAALAQWAFKLFRLAKNTSQPNEFDSANITTSDAKAPKASALDIWIKNELVKGLVALALTCAFTMVLLKFSAQAGRALLIAPDQSHVTASRVPQLGQIIFAVAASFFLATALAQLVLDARLRYFLPAPMIVAIIAYLIAAQPAFLRPLANAAAPFLPASITFAAILPLQYVGVGTLAVALGYWYGLKWRVQTGRQLPSDFPIAQQVIG